MVEALLIDITNAGSGGHLDTTNVRRVSVSTPMPSFMGSAVIEIKRVISGRPSSYGPKKTITSSSPAETNIDTEGVDQLVFEVTTASSSGQEIQIVAYGETVE